MIARLLTLAELDEAARHLDVQTGWGYERCLVWCQAQNRQMVAAMEAFDANMKSVVEVFARAASYISDFVGVMQSRGVFSDIQKRAERRRRHASWQAQRRA